MCQNRQHVSGYMLVGDSLHCFLYFRTCVKTGKSGVSVCRSWICMNLSPSLGSYFLHVGFVLCLFPWGSKDGPLIAPDFHSIHLATLGERECLLPNHSSKSPRADAHCF